jgi:ATP/ADP translocase
VCTAVACRLANEITNLSDAATLYPLFGLGANLAQAIAGLVLKVTVVFCNWQLRDTSEGLA